MNWPAAARMLDVGHGQRRDRAESGGGVPDAEVHAVDISEDALALARENAARFGVAERVQFSTQRSADGCRRHVRSDRRESPIRLRRRIAPRLRAKFCTIRQTALFGGPAGDEIIRRLIDAARVHLKPGGMLALEIGIGQAEALTAFLREQNYHEISPRQDFGGVTRFLLARYG